MAEELIEPIDTDLAKLVPEPEEALPVGVGAEQLPPIAQAAPEELIAAPGVAEIAPAPTPIAREIKPEETVSWQLNKLLSEGSPYIEQAKRTAAEVMSGRGQLSSSLATGEAVEAAITRGAPIAAQEASTAAAAGLSAQQSGERLGEAGYKGLVTEALQGEQAQENLILQRDQAASQQILAQYGFQNQVNLTELKADVDFQLKDMGIDADGRRAFAASYGPLSQEYTRSMQEIILHPEQFSSSTAQQSAINQLDALFVPRVKSLANIFGYEVNVDDIVAG